jgi:alanine racemase
MNCGTEASINLVALIDNLHAIKAKVGNCKILAMIKSNAYGHGILKVAGALEEADAFGVACLGEAITLRKSGFDKRIVMLFGFGTEVELNLISEYHFDTLVHNSLQLEILQKAKLLHPINVWLKIDTGMHRLGFDSDKFADAYAILSHNSNVYQPVNFMTHFACADVAGNAHTKGQLEKFSKLVADFDNPKSAANSSAIINWPESYFDWVRPGITLYGISPINGKTGLDHGLKPVMTLRSRLISVKTVKKGEYLGYGATWQCPEDMPVGIAAFGYGDGYPRHAEAGTPILVDDVQCQIVGRVAMDMTTIDLRNMPNAKPGDHVVLWGEGLPIEKIAEHTGTIPYELLCGLTRRVKFV